MSAGARDPGHIDTALFEELDPCGRRPAIDVIREAREAVVTSAEVV